MGMADAAGDAATAPNRDAATRPILNFMMFFLRLRRTDTEIVLIKLWRNRNVNADEQIFSQPAAGLIFGSGRLSQVRALHQCSACVCALQDIATILDPAQFTGAASSLSLALSPAFRAIRRAGSRSRFGAVQWTK
jgi:hypothetical protein